MLAAGLQGCRDVQNVVTGVARSGGDVDHGRLVAGERAGLVQGDGSDPAEGLQGGTALDQGADAARGADGGDHGDRHGDRQRTRGGGDQDDQGALDPRRRVTQQATDDRDDRGEDHDPGHQRLGDPVGEALSVALAGLLGLDDGDDPGQGVVLGGGGDLDFEDSGAVDGAGVDGVAGAGLDGDGFAGERGDVQGGAAGADDAVGGDALTWAD
jgi:hypothetical protein